MFCSACGQELSDEAAFCWKCGSAVGEAARKAAPSARSKGARRAPQDRVTEARKRDPHWGEELDFGDVSPDLSDEEHFEDDDELDFGDIGSWSGSPNPGALGYANLDLVCPHCHRRGGVYTREVKTKKGISGAKATGALLTGGLSVLATGLSRKEHVTEAHCKRCGSTWHF